jgi:hypothetical protein
VHNLFSFGVILGFLLSPVKEASASETTAEIGIRTRRNIAIKAE